MAITRNQFSFLSTSDLFQIGNTIFWGKTRPPEIEPRDDDRAHIIKVNERIDTLAFEELGSEHLGWVIMLRNNLSLWPNDFEPGKKIFIPSREGLSDRGIV